MRVHPGVGELGAGIQCRALVGGLGTPGLRDLDFGRQVVGYLQHLDWPEAVVVEDLACSAHLVLDRLQELRPAKVVLLGTAARGLDPPGTVRRYQLDLAPPSPEQVHQGLTDTLGGRADIDHTLAVVSHWGGFPVDTTVIEVEPLDCSFGPGFSEELGECIEAIQVMVREELGLRPAGSEPLPGLTVEELTAPALPSPTLVEAVPDEPSMALLAMAEYAAEHERCRLAEPYRSAPSARMALPPDVEVAVRSRSWGVGLGAGGDWHELIPLGSAKMVVVVGNVVGRGVEAVAAMSELRTASRAYALLEDESPGRLVSRMDRLVEVTGLGDQAALTALVVTPETGEILFSSAGACPLLVLGGDGRSELEAEGGGPPLGTGRDGARPEASVRLAGDSTLLLFTEGLVRAQRGAIGNGTVHLLEAAADAPRPLEELCEHVFAACVGDMEREDDALLLALRLGQLDLGLGGEPAA